MKGLILTFLLSIFYSPTIVPKTTPIPDSEVIINYQVSGLDWCYAGATPPGILSRLRMQGPNYRKAERWRYSTPEEWANRPTWEEFTRPGQEVPWDIEEFCDHKVYRFTSQYWSNYDFVDLMDAANGFIWSGPNAPDHAHETWYVRETKDITASD